MNGGAEVVKLLLDSNAAANAAVLTMGPQLYVWLLGVLVLRQ